MARQFRIEYAGCTWAAGRVLAPSFRLGEDQMNADECAKLRFDPFDPFDSAMSYYGHTVTALIYKGGTLTV
jgi:hypothetical protein